MQVISVNNQYSSGFKRLIAFFIDHIAIGALVSIALWPLWGFPFEFENLHRFRLYNTDLITGGLSIHNLLRETFIIIYYALMESSKYQATLGKIVIGIKVVNNNGQRLDFSKTLLRNLSKILSAFILGIGYIMIIFDDRKQGLHDKIADTFVVKQ